MGKHDHPQPPPENYIDLKIILKDENNNPLTGWARIDGLNPQSTWVSEFGAQFGNLKQHGGFNLNITSDGYIDKWVPIDVVPEERLVINLEKIPAPVYKKRKGNVRIINKSAIDDDGFHLFLGTTLFPYRWMLDNSQLRIDDNLRFLAESDIDYIRYFVEVGNPNDDTDGWSDRKTDPSTFTERYINYAYDNFGIRSAICIFGGCFYSDTRDKRINTVQRVIDVVKKCSEKVIWIEIVNEFHGQLDDADEVRSLCNLVQSQLPNVLCIPSSPEGWQEDFDTIYKDNTGTLGSIHHERVDKEAHWGYVRGPYSARELERVPSAFTNDEGVGPKSSGVSDDDPLRLGFFAATGYIVREPFFTLHTGAGVYMGGKGGITHNREANIYEVNNIDSILDAINNVRSLLPQDVTSWPEYNGNRSEHLLPADYVWADDNSFTSGVLRCYMAISGNNFVMLPYSIFNFADFTAKVNMNVRVYDIMNGEKLDETNLSSGNKIRLSGRADKNAGYLVLGSF